MNRYLSALLVATCVFTPLTYASAQPRDPGQQKFDYLFGHRQHSARSAGTRINHARQYTQQLYDYAQTAPPQHVTPAITRVESEHLGQTIQAARQNLAAVKQDLNQPTNPAVVKKVEAVEKYLEAALQHHKQLDMECCKDQVDGQAIAECCDEVLTNLDKALAEQASLMRLLGIAPKADAAPKVSPPKDAPK